MRKCSGAVFFSVYLNHIIHNIEKQLRILDLRALLVGSNQSTYGSVNLDFLTTERTRGKEKMSTTLSGAYIQGTVCILS